jgi:hypothetical protein
LPYAAVTHLAQPPHPGREPQPIAREAGITAQHGHFADVPGKAGAGTVGQAHFQGRRLAQQWLQFEIRTGRQDDDIACADFLYRIVGGERFDQKLARPQVRTTVADGECVEPGRARKLRQQGRDLFHQGIDHEFTLSKKK